MDSNNINFGEVRIVFIPDSKKLAKRKNRPSINILEKDPEKEARKKRERKIINHNFEYKTKKIRDNISVAEKERLIRERKDQIVRVNQIKSARKKLKKLPTQRFINRFRYKNFL